MAGVQLYRAPATCPVCSDELITLRVGCPTCGTELSGHFTQCRFCQLDGSERALLEVFLRSRGNVKEVQAFLGVSYPTARQRVADLLAELGFGDPTAAEPTDPAPVNVATTRQEPAPQRQGGPPVPGDDAPSTAEILTGLASGQLTVSQAEEMLSAILRTH
jgi:hypothetical protein